MKLLDTPCPYPKQTNSGHSPHPIPIPPTCQPLGKGCPPPQCHPERKEGGSARVIAGAWGPLGAWSLQGPLEFPQAEKKGASDPSNGHPDPGCRSWARAMPYSDGSYAGTSPLPPPQGKTPEPAGRIYATKLLPQGHYVSPVYLLPRANPQPRGIKMNCLPGPPGPQQRVPETGSTYKAQGYRRGKLLLVRGVLWTTAGTMPASRGEIKVPS